MAAFHPEPRRAPAARKAPAGLAITLALALVAGGGPGSQNLTAQEPDSDSHLQGRLFLGDSPADSGTVVLHRVTPEEAGPLDSIQVDTEGNFRLQLPVTPTHGSGEIFFVSHRYEGTLYFGAPLALPEQVDSLYTIRAYPSRPAPPEGIGFRVSVRNLFVEEGPMGWQVTDLVELRNDSAVTWVPDPEVDGAVVWSLSLPAEARAFRVGEGDLARGTITLEDGAVRLRAPLIPGDRLLVFHYELPSLETTLPVGGPTEVLEFLVRQPAPSLRVDGLQAAGPMEIERGISYFRWWGENLQEGTIRIRPGEEGETPVAWIAVGLGLLLALLGSWLVLRRPGAGPVGRKGAGAAAGLSGEGPGPGTPPGAAGASTPWSRRRALLLEVAQLDEKLEEVEHSGTSTPESRKLLRVRREELIRELESLEAGGSDSGPAPVGATDGEEKGPEGRRS